MLHKAVQYSSFITEQMSKYQAEILGSKEQARPCLPASLPLCGLVSTRAMALDAVWILDSQLPQVDHVIHNGKYFTK